MSNLDLFCIENIDKVRKFCKQKIAGKSARNGLMQKVSANK